MTKTWFLNIKLTTEENGYYWNSTSSLEIGCKNITKLGGKNVNHEYRDWREV